MATTVIPSTCYFASPTVIVPNAFVPQATVVSLSTVSVALAPSSSSSAVDMLPSFV